jgi:Family of unknown function (DUF6325)
MRGHRSGDATSARESHEHRGRAVNDEVEELGPIDYPVVEFPGNRMTGEGLPLLVDLVDRGLVRILGPTFVRKEEDGSVSGLEVADLTGDGALDPAVFEGASSGLLGQTTSRRPRAPWSPAVPPASWSVSWSRQYGTASSRPPEQHSPRT